MSDSPWAMPEDAPRARAGLSREALDVAELVTVALHMLISETGAIGYNEDKLFNACQIALSPPPMPRSVFNHLIAALLRGRWVERQDGRLFATGRPLC